MSPGKVQIMGWISSWLGVASGCLPGMKDLPCSTSEVTFQGCFIVRVSESTIHLVCVMTGASTSCVILSCTAQGRGTPPPCSHSCDGGQAELQKRSSRSSVLHGQCPEQLIEFYLCTQTGLQSARWCGPRCSFGTLLLLLLLPLTPSPSLSLSFPFPPCWSLARPDGLPHQWRFPESHPVCASHQRTVSIQCWKNRIHSLTLLAHDAIVNNKSYTFACKVGMVFVFRHNRHFVHFYVRQ